MQNQLDIPKFPQRKRFHVVFSADPPSSNASTSIGLGSSISGTTPTTDGNSDRPSAPSAWEVVRESIYWLTDDEMESMWPGGKGPAPAWLVALPDIVAFQERRGIKRRQVSNPGNLSVEDRQMMEQKPIDDVFMLNIAIMRLNPVTLAWLSKDKEIQIKGLFAKKDAKEIAAFRQLVSDSLTRKDSSEDVPNKTAAFDQMLKGVNQVV
ncbi:hypothetical protein QFC20_002846 [Naganishia adeliensis]|uniref:Uncharacterized protein n=1 Tax=Naganishia adeliensis TaxID=92952 RepID=A0ACC2WGC6_9TREE|nr:hypothetical protein QFC20_002846 [Naganishia adeliensis]